MWSSVNVGSGVSQDELRKQLLANLDPSAERKAANLRKKLSAETLQKR
jgi:hypothetical protein